MRLLSLLCTVVIFPLVARGDTASCLALSECADVTPLISQCATTNLGCVAQENALAVSFASLVDDAIAIQGCNRSFRSGRDCSRCFNRAKELLSLGKQPKKLFGSIASQVKAGLELRRQVICEGSQSSFVVANGNLDARSSITTIPAGAPTFIEIAGAASFLAYSTVVDSLGTTHTITIAFFKAATNTFTAALYVDGGEVGGTAGIPYSVGLTTIGFDTNGARLALGIPIDVSIIPTWSNGAAANPIAFYFNVTQRSFDSAITITAH